MTVDIGFPAPEVYEAELHRMVDAQLASRIAHRDADVWGADAAELAANRLGWTDLHTRAAGLIEQIIALRDELARDGIDRIYLAGMGGSSLGAEVIAAAHDVELTVIDTTDPVDIAALRDGDGLARSALVVGTKSGTTIETVSAASAYAQALLAAGIEPRSRLIAVTDPDTPLAEQAVDEGWRRVFLADPRVGGRFSALAAFGLVPAGLAGADVQGVVDEAAAVASATAQDSEENPALQLAAALTAAHARGIRTLALASTDTALDSLPYWLEQLIAESTGKEGLGILPVACEGVYAHGFHDAHAATALGYLGEAVGDRQPTSGTAVAYSAPLGAQLLVWETAVAMLAAGIGVNPFDQPDVEAAKVRALELLDGSGPNDDDAPLFIEGAVEVRSNAPLDEGNQDLKTAIAGLFSEDEDSFLAVQAFLSAQSDSDAAALRNLLAQKSGGTVAFGWGPRYLHSTGQFHKGGRPAGAYLFLTASDATSPYVEIPMAEFGFAQLQIAQARADVQVLEELGRPVLHLTLTDRAEGLAQVREAVEALPDLEPLVPEDLAHAGQVVEADSTNDLQEDPPEEDTAATSAVDTDLEEDVLADGTPAVDASQEADDQVGDAEQLDDSAEPLEFDDSVETDAVVEEDTEVEEDSAVKEHTDTEDSTVAEDPEESR